MDIPKTFKIAVCSEVVARPGDKPDFGPPGKFGKDLTPKQRDTRDKLTKHFKLYELTPQQIAKAICKGYTITAWHAGGTECKKKSYRDQKTGQVLTHKCKAEHHRLNDNFLAGQHLGVDFDQLTTPSEVFNNPLVRAYGSIIYFTPSSKPDKPKMRVILLLDQPVIDPQLYKEIVLTLLWKFEGKGDEACKDLCRLFYGCLNTEIIVTDKVLPLAVVMQWVEEWRAANPQKAKRTRASAAPGKPREVSEYNRDDNRPSTPYGMSALKNAAEELRKINTAGMYYAPLNKHAFCMGQLVAGGELNYNEAYQGLIRATQDWPLDAGGADRRLTIKIGLTDGEKEPYKAPALPTGKKEKPKISARGEKRIVARYNGLIADREINESSLSCLHMGYYKFQLLGSPKGSGKTRELTRLIKKYLKQGYKVVVVGHRVSLLKEAAHRHGLAFYQDFSGKDAYEDMSNQPGIAICEDSLYKLDISQFGNQKVILIWDESEQGLLHLTGNTIKDTRAQNQARLECLIRIASRIICLDADMSATTRNFMQRIIEDFPPEREEAPTTLEGAQPVLFEKQEDEDGESLKPGIEIVLNMHTAKPKIFLAYHRQNALITELRAQLKAGLKPCITTNSKTFSKKLLRQLNTEFPELGWFLVHADNVARPDIQDQIEHINEAVVNYDYVIFSPSVGTGVSIDAEHFDSVFIFGFTNVNTHYDLLQQAGRVRNPKSGKVHCWVSPQRRWDLKTDPSHLLKDIETNLLENGIATDYDAQTRERLLEPREVRYMKLVADVKAARHTSWQDLRGNFYSQAEAEGNTVVIADPGPGDKNIASLVEFDEIELEQTKVGKAQAKEELKEERAAAILAEVDITEAEYKEIEEKKYKEPELARCERYRIQDFYGAKITRQLIEQDAQGRMQPKLIAFMDLLHRDQAVKGDLRSANHEGRMLADSPLRTLRRDLRREILLTAGLVSKDDPDAPLKIFNTETLKEREVHLFARNNRERIERILGIKIRADISDNPCQFITAVLEQIGLATEVRKQYRVGNGERRRDYGIALSQFDLMVELADNRLQWLERKQATPSLEVWMVEQEQEELARAA